MKIKREKFVILDIPLLLENKILKKKYFFSLYRGKKSDISKRIKKERTSTRNFLLNLKIQLPLEYKKEKSDFIIKNNFTKKNIRRT